MLPALTGAWKHRGGGGQLSTSGAFQWNKKALERPDLALASPLGRLARVVNMSELGHALTELGIDQRTENRDQKSKPEPNGPAVHALFVYNSNPGAVAPNHNAVCRGMMRDDLFTVVHEQFFTDTTDYADYILPATTFLEHTDVQGAYGHYFVQLSKQAIEPPGEARSNVWLFGQLAQRMGFTEACFRDTPEEMIRQALAIGADGRSTNADMEHITFEDLEREGHIPLAFHANPRSGHSCRTLPVRSRRLPARSSSIRRRWPQPVPMRFRILFRRPNRAGAKRRRNIRWNCWRARTTTT